MLNVLESFGIDPDILEDKINLCQNFLTEAYELCKELDENKGIEIYCYDKLTLDLAHDCISELGCSIVNFDDLTEVIVSTAFDVTTHALNYVFTDNNVDLGISFSNYVNFEDDGSCYMNIHFNRGNKETTYEYYEKGEFESALISELTESLLNLIKSELNIDYLNEVDINQWVLEKKISLAAIIKSVLENKLDEEIINTINNSQSD